MVRPGAGALRYLHRHQFSPRHQRHPHMTELSAHDRRQRRILIGVALMFFAPLALSFYLYYGKYWHPGGRVNAGELIDPARPLPPLALPLAQAASDGALQTNPQFLKGKWTLLYVQQG